VSRYEDPECHRHHARLIRNIAEGQSNLDHSRRRLLGLDLMARLASFACESMTSRDIVILRFRAESRCGQSGCEGRGMSRLTHTILFDESS
jgi:hypothetical protein